MIDTCPVADGISANAAQVAVGSSSALSAREPESGGPRR